MGLVFFTALICRQPDPDGPVIRGSYSTRAGCFSSARCRNGGKPHESEVMEPGVRILPGSDRQIYLRSKLPAKPMACIPPHEHCARFQDTGTLPDIQAPCREAPLAGAVLPTGAPSGSGRLPQCPACDAPARQKTPPPGKTRRGSFQFRLKPDGYSPAFSVRKSSANWACMAAPRCSTSSGTLYFSWWLV